MAVASPRVFWAVAYNLLFRPSPRIAHRWRNLLLRGYFATMGFPTLRHVGTGDHLHVSLRPETEAA